MSKTSNSPSTKILPKEQLHLERKSCESASSHFEPQRDPQINFDNPNLVKAQIENGKAIVPNGWKDEEDGDESN